jgi:hypothetical protein
MTDTVVKILESVLHELCKVAQPVNKRLLWSSRVIDRRDTLPGVFFHCRSGRRGNFLRGRRSLRARRIDRRDGCGRGNPHKGGTLLANRARCYIRCYFRRDWL